MVLSLLVGLKSVYKKYVYVHRLVPELQYANNIHILYFSDTTRMQIGVLIIYILNNFSHKYDYSSNRTLMIKHTLYIFILPGQCNTDIQWTRAMSERAV